MLSKVTSLVVIASVVGLAILDALVAVYVFQLYPSNHSGYDVRWGYAICGLVLLLAIISLLWLRAAKWACVTSMGLSVGTFIGVYVFDHFNMLVQYGPWLKRGMPPFGG